MIALVLVATLQIAPPADDPHRGRYTTGGRLCTRCHGRNNPHADDAYQMAQKMSKMVDGMNRGPLRGASIDCVSCHRRNADGTSAMYEDKTRFAAIQRIVDNWPAGPKDPPDRRRMMARYSVALGVSCYYCHEPRDWASAVKPAMKSAREMIAMMSEFQKYFELPSIAAEISCNTCHQGSLRVPHDVK